MTQGTPSVAWVNGTLTPRSEARISIDDFGARYGAACFETMLARHGRIFRLGAHLDRLQRGLRGMQVEPPLRTQLRDAVTETLAANGLRDASVRLTVSAGHGHAPDLAAAREPAVVVTADVLPPPAPPARLRVVSVRLDERRPLADAKVANFLPYLLARAEARDAGADDALMLNHDGAIAEAATANLFAVIAGTLFTPRVEDGPLPGITRAALIEVAAATGLACEERTLHLGELADAEAVFLTSSVQGIRGVVSIVGEGIDWQAPSEEHPRVAQLAVGYEALVERECGG